MFQKMMRLQLFYDTKMLDKQLNLWIIKVDFLIIQT